LFGKSHTRNIIVGSESVSVMKLRQELLQSYGSSSKETEARCESSRRQVKRTRIVSKSES
jgi:hypothetical protein